MITIFCWVYHDESPFSVDISREKTIDKLKDTIVAKNLKKDIILSRVFFASPVLLSQGN